MAIESSVPLNAETLGDWIEEERATLEKWLFSLGCPHDSIGDVIQETYCGLTVTFKRDKEVPSGQLTYLKRACRSKFLDFCRAKKRERGTTSLDTLPLELPAVERARVVSGDEVDRFLIALSQLSEADQQALLLKHDEGCSHDEIAQRLGITVAASKKRLSRAEERLEQLMNELTSGQVAETK